MTDLENNDNISSYIRGLLEVKKDVVEEEFNFTGKAPVTPNTDSQIINYTIDADHSGAMVLIRGWVPAKETIKSPIVIVHDFAESSANYKKACLDLSERGYPVYTYDMRGHGRNGSIRTGDATFEAYINDLLQIANWIRFKSDRRKPIILTQGLSSLLVSIFAERHPDYVKAIGLISPIMLTEKGPGLLWRASINGIREFFPYKSIPRRFLPDFLTTFERDIESSKSFYFSYQLVHEFLEELEESDENFSKLSVHTSLFYGSKKTQISYEEICRRINKHEHKELFNVYSMDDDISHPLSSEVDKIESLLSNLIPWLEKREEEES